MVDDVVKKILFFMIMVLFMPIMVSAEVFFVESDIPANTIILKDTEVCFNKRFNINIFIDNVSVNDSISTSSTYELNNSFIAPSDMIIKTINYDSDNQKLTVYFETKALPKVHCFIEEKEPSQITSPNNYFDKKYCDDYIEPGKYYSSKDAIYLYSSASILMFYDKEGEPLVNLGYSQFMNFPELNGEETYWIYTDAVNAGYNYYISPMFEEYIPPKFEFKCSPKTIKYGEKSVCTLYAKKEHNLTDVSFDLDSKEYKILSATFPDGIKEIEGDKQFNLRISDSVEQDSEGFVLGVFEITGNKNQEYNNQVQVINLGFTDEKVSGEYENLEDPIQIIAVATESSKETNPITSAKSILIPSALFVISVFVYFIVEVKMKKIKN